MLHQRLLDWESHLEPEMHFGASRRREVMFLVGMLQMTYKYVILLSGRRKPVADLSRGQ